jgi:hypothetical protein
MTRSIAMAKWPTVAILLALVLLGPQAQADEAIRYVFAKAGPDGGLVYLIDGSRFREDQLPAFFEENRRDWPKDGVQVRVVFRSDVSLQWFDYGCRSFRIRGFSNIRCYSGSVRTGRAIEIKPVGEVIALPVERW